MESSSAPTPTNYQQVTVDVPEDRIAEFHAFFARFLAGRPGVRRRHRHGRPQRGRQERRCAERGEAADSAEVTAERGEATEV